MEDLKAKVAEILADEADKIGVDTAIELSDKIDKAINSKLNRELNFTITGVVLVGILSSRKSGY